MIIDTHAHLNAKVFDKDRTDVLDRASAAGVSGVVSVSETFEETERNLALSALHPILFPGAGLFPSQLNRDQAQKIVTFLRSHRKDFFAVGEVGLDFWVVKNEEERELQREIFRIFINASKELDLPLNVHSRSAGRAVIELLTVQDAQRVQLHAFDGKTGSALPGVEAGYYFSVPPSVVRSRQKQKLVRALPMSCLLIETDSPVLGPEPQERNEPVNAAVAVNAVAELKGITEQEVRETTAANTEKLYGRLCR